MMKDSPRKNTIYIVDDQAENLKLLSHILKQPEYRVLAFNNPENALNKISSDLPDLILLDIMMPGMSGFQLNQILKENPKTSGIPVIFISAREDTESKLMAFEHGAADYIVKPFSNREVQMRVRTKLQYINTRRELEEIKKTLEEKVKIRTYNLKQAQRVANIGSWRIDLSSNEMKWSEQSFEIFGLKKTKTLSLKQTLEPVLESALPILQNTWKKALQKAKRKAKKKTFSAQYRINRKGEIRWIEEHGEFFENENGEIAYAIGTLQDITQQKRQLELLEKQNKTLREISWVQSHVVRAPLARLKGLMDLYAEKDFEFMSEQSVHQAILDATEEFENIILEISQKTYVVDEIEGKIKETGKKTVPGMEKASGE
ncbi:MAG: response regulator [Balneolales bacterium]|nr:response regulator [Balneolales bacterium]